MDTKDDSQLMTFLEVSGPLLDVDRLLGFVSDKRADAVWHRGDSTDLGAQPVSGLRLSVFPGGPRYSHAALELAIEKFLEKEAGLVAELRHLEGADVELHTALFVHAFHPPVGVSLPAPLLNQLSGAGIGWRILSVPCAEDGAIQTTGAPSNNAADEVRAGQAPRPSPLISVLGGRWRSQRRMAPVLIEPRPSLCHLR